MAVRNGSSAVRREIWCPPAGTFLSAYRENDTVKKGVSSKDRGCPFQSRINRSSLAGRLATERRRANSSRGESRPRRSAPEGEAWTPRSTVAHRGAWGHAGPLGRTRPTARVPRTRAVFGGYPRFLEKCPKKGGDAMRHAQLTKSKLKEFANEADTPCCHRLAARTDRSEFGDQAMARAMAPRGPVGEVVNHLGEPFRYEVMR